jgi:hypothetical protein
VAYAVFCLLYNASASVPANHAAEGRMLQSDHDRISFLGIGEYAFLHKRPGL